MIEYQELIEQKLEDEKQRDLSEMKLKTEVSSLKKENEERERDIALKQEKLKDKADKKIYRRIVRFKVFSLIFIIIYVVLIVFLFCKLDSFGQGMIALLIALAPLVIGWIYAIIKSKEFSFIALYKFLENKYLNYTHKKIYAEYEIELE